MASPSFKSREWPRFLSAPDPQLLNELYVPGLAMSLRYDRCCAYFSSTSLQAAAMGFGKLIERLEAMGSRAPKPAIRLLVNEELDADDLRALTERGDARPLEKHLGKRFKNPTEALQRQRLAMLAWLAKRGLLEVRVGIMRTSGGILHAKFGAMHDSHGNTLVFRGSSNESASGILANYEMIEVSPSWREKEVSEHYLREFETLWAGTHPSVMTVPLPDAIRDKLIRLAPKQPPTEEPSPDIARQRAAMVWQWLAEAPYMEFGDHVCDATSLVPLWPHQRRVVADTAAAWPEGRLLCDEVGMGKTLEAIVILRRLLAGRGVKRALILVPAGLTRQWQAELREKGGLRVPRLEGDDLVWPDGRQDKQVGLANALKKPILLLSRETARTDANLRLLQAADPWDLVVLDEAHAARRSSNGAGDFNSANLLLGMLRELQVTGQARSFLLLSATPMQTMPWEPWDMLQILGEGGPWLADFDDVRAFYNGIVLTEKGEIDKSLAQRCAHLVAADPDFPTHSDHPEWKTPSVLADVMQFGAPETRTSVARWLRHGSPLSRRLHRNTRATLHGYYRLGLLERPPAKRKVIDGQWDFQDTRERDLYLAVEEYILKRWAAMEEERRGKGFVMTIYKRRAASSWAALRRSLGRRLELVERYIKIQAVADPTRLDLPEDFDAADLPYDLDVDWPNSAPSTLEEATYERDQLRKFLKELEDLGGQDSKVVAFAEVLEAITSDGRPALVFTEYMDTLTYLRDTLLPKYSGACSLATYSGSGGQWFDGSNWVSLTKDEVARKLQDGQLQVVICTDAASEGLNLQAAAALVNYDLPWNPSKVEQRIGRIDRIGQAQPEIRIVNMLLRNSVDDQVYGRLRERCGMFEHFVGRMQPVLSHAKRLLLGHTLDIESLEAAIRNAESDTLTRETYLETEPEPAAGSPQHLNRQDLLAALDLLRDVKGVTVSSVRDLEACVVKLPGMKRMRVGCSLRALEHDAGLIPLSPTDEVIRQIAVTLGMAQSGLPLVIATVERGPFRASAAYWIAQGGPVRVERASQLLALVAEWDGEYVDYSTRHDVLRRAIAEVEQRVNSMEAECETRMRRMRERQLSAVRYRLTLALARTLAAQTESADQAKMNNRMFELMNRGGSSATILDRAYKKLQNYPIVPPFHTECVADYVDHLTKAKMEAATSLTMVIAALDDPRWRLLDLLPH